MPFKPLFEIRVEHPFYRSGLCADARIVPQETTAARLRGLRLMAIDSVGGLTLVSEFGTDGTTTIAIPQVTLSFDLLRLPGEVEAATDLSAIAAGTVFVDGGAASPMKPTVRNSRNRETLAKPAGVVDLVLGGRPAAGCTAADFHVADPAQGVTVKNYDPTSNIITLRGPAADCVLDYPSPPRPTPNALAAIEVGIDSDIVAQAAAGKPRRFTITLKARAAPWCFHVVTDLANPLGEWHITHPAGDGPAATFGSAGSAEIGSPDPADPFGSVLLSRSSPLRVLRFVSDAPVACSEERARRLALFAGDRQLFSAMPNPSPSELRLLGGQPVFGEVLRFVTT